MYMGTIISDSEIYVYSLLCSVKRGVVRRGLGFLFYIYSDMYTNLLDCLHRCRDQDTKHVDIELVVFACVGWW